MCQQRTSFDEKREASFRPLGRTTRRLLVQLIVVTALIAAGCSTGCSSDKEARQDAEPPTEAHLQDAREKLKANELDEAEASLESAEEQGAPDYKTDDLAAGIERRRAEAALDEGDFEAAVEHYARASELATTQAQRFEDVMSAIDAGERGGLPEEELAPLATRATELKTSSEEAQRTAAQLWDDAGYPDNALPHYQWLHKVDPNDISVATRLGNLLVAEGKLSQAKEVLERVHKLEPDNAIAGLKLADVYDRLDEPDEAEAVYETLVAEHPERAGVLMRYANFLQKRGETERAAEFRERAREAQPATEEREMRELR